MISENTCPSFGDLKGDSSADKKISAEGIKTDCRGIFEKMPSRKTNEIKGLKTAIFSVRYDKTGEKRADRTDAVFAVPVADNPTAAYQ